MQDKELSGNNLMPLLEKLMTDDALVGMAKAGEQSACMELCERHSGMAKRMISRILRNTEDTEDVLQESILKVYLHLNGFDERSKFSTWFAKISVNSALMLLRKRNSRQMQSYEDFSEESNGEWRYLSDQHVDPEYFAVQAQLLHQMRQAIRNLPPILRGVTELRQSSDLSVEEVAERVGLSVSATKSRLLRARRVLASKMGCARSQPLKREKDRSQRSSKSVITKQILA